MPFHKEFPLDQLSALSAFVAEGISSGGFDKAQQREENAPRVRKNCPELEAADGDGLTLTIVVR